MKDTDIKELNSFVFYRSYHATIRNLQPEEQLQMYNAIIDYGLNREEPSFPEGNASPYLSAIWESIRPQLDANYQRFLNGCRGGAPSGNQNARKQPKNNQKQPNVDVNVNDDLNVDVCIKALPYSSNEFVSTWKELKKQPKWRHKTKEALTKSLEQLSTYPEGFAIELMNRAIANNYQGVTFPSTGKDFTLWKQSHPAKASGTSGKIITKVEDLF